MSAIEREARRDAREFARAQMYYGEGAGTRRKIIGAKVDSKTMRSEAYGRAFHQELTRQDMAVHAAKAQRERHFKDRTHSANKNLRGLATGNYQNVNTSILVFAAVAYLAHQTGLDRRAYEQGQKFVQRVKTHRWAKKSNKNTVHNITSVK